MIPRQIAFRGLFAITLAVLASSCTSPPAPSISDLNWHPDLDQPAGQLEEVLAATEQQQPRNYTIANIASVLDAKLYILFNRYIAGLPPTNRAAAIQEQCHWLERRNQETTKADAEYEGGTFASFAGSRAFIEFTRARIALLQQRIGSSSTATAR
jgi:uncharacterized protein YecT (DUF1311 family)